MSIRLPSELGALQGFLLKKGAVGLKKFKRRYFRQDKDKLFYFNNPSDEPLGCIDLSNFTLGRLIFHNSYLKSTDVSLPRESNGFPFHINTPNRLYQLVAPSVEDYTFWTRGLNEYKNLKRNLVCYSFLLKRLM
jgi:hypothetical protein